jgi:hypothetical protein
MLRICQIRVGSDAMIAHSNDLGKRKSLSSRAKDNRLGQTKSQASQAEDDLATPVGRIAPKPAVRLSVEPCQTDLFQTFSSGA